MKLYLLYGGKSAEHDVSIISASNILEEIYYNIYQVIPVYITQDGHWLKGDLIESTDDLPSLAAMRLDDSYEELDFSELKGDDVIVFPVLHGPNGEDGTIQGFLEVLDVPYVGAGVLGSATGMDKIVSKTLFEAAGIPILPFIPVFPAEWAAVKEEVIERIEDKLRYPLYVKPANLGSSVGISEVVTSEELEEAINLAFSYDNRVLVEQGIIAREVEIAVLGNEDVHTSVVGELVKETQFYDYDSKYLNNEVTLQIPAMMSSQLSSQLREYAATAFLAIGGAGLSRADFFVTADEEIYINELNTFPGFTSISMYPKLWEATGLSYSDLIEELIQLGLQRYESRRQSYGKQRK